MVWTMVISGAGVTEDDDASVIFLLEKRVCFVARPLTDSFPSTLFFLCVNRRVFFFPLFSLAPGDSD